MSIAELAQPDSLGAYGNTNLTPQLDDSLQVIALANVFNYFSILLNIEYSNECNCANDPKPRRGVLDFAKAFLYITKQPLPMHFTRFH